jgi:hypothetical protein
MTATLQDKIEQKIDEGFEAITHEICAKIGDSEVHRTMTPESLVYGYDLADKGKKLMIEAGDFRTRLFGFLRSKGAGPTDQEREDQRQMDLDDAIAAEKGRSMVSAARVAAAAAELGEVGSVSLNGVEVYRKEPRLTEAEAEDLKARLDVRLRCSEG